MTVKRVPRLVIFLDALAVCMYDVAKGRKHFVKCEDPTESVMGYLKSSPGMPLPYQAGRERKSRSVEAYQEDGAAN